EERSAQATSQHTSQAKRRNDRNRRERSALREVVAVEVRYHALVDVDVLNVDEERQRRRPPLPRVVDAQVELMVEGRAFGVRLAIDRDVKVAIAVEDRADRQRVGQAGVELEA